jgi:hypothetical protein
MQYVLAELSEEQMAEFESALADNVSLCEAVVEACRLSAGVTLALESERLTVHPVMISRQRSWSTRFGVLAACASLLAVLVIMAGSPVAERRSGMLLTLDDAAAADVLVGLLQEQLSLGIDPESDVESVPDESLSDLMAPEWLLTAVDLDERDASDDDEQPADDSNVF